MPKSCIHRRFFGIRPVTAASLRAAIEVALRQHRLERQRRAAACETAREQCRAALAETISSILDPDTRPCPAAVTIRPAPAQDSEPGSDPLRGFELQAYSPAGETLWAADAIQAVQSPRGGSIRLQGSLRELLPRIED